VGIDGALIRGAMLMSLVLVGKSHVMQGPEPGCARKPFCDSHASDQDGTEIVIFDSDQVKPLFTTHHLDLDSCTLNPKLKTLNPKP